MGEIIEQLYLSIAKPLAWIKGPYFVSLKFGSMMDETKFWWLSESLQWSDWLLTLTSPFQKRITTPPNFDWTPTATDWSYTNLYSILSWYAYWLLLCISRLIFPKVQGQHGVGTWVQKPDYQTYKSPYGPKYAMSLATPSQISVGEIQGKMLIGHLVQNSYRIGRNFHGISAGRALKLYVNLIPERSALDCSCYTGARDIQED